MALGAALHIGRDDRLVSVLGFSHENPGMENARLNCTDRCFVWPCRMACGALISDHGFHVGPWQWEHAVLTTGPPRNFQGLGEVLLLG